MSRAGSRGAPLRSDFGPVRRLGIVDSLSGVGSWVSMGRSPGRSAVLTCAETTYAETSEMRYRELLGRRRGRRRVAHGAGSSPPHPTLRGHLQEVIAATSRAPAGRPVLTHTGGNWPHRKTCSATTTRATTSPPVVLLVAPGNPTIRPPASRHPDPNPFSKSSARAASAVNGPTARSSP